MQRPNLKSLALPVPEIIAIEVLGGGCEPPSGRTGGRRGSGIVPFERALVSSYRPSIVTFPLSLRVSEILPLLCSRTPLYPTPSLLSPKFPHVPMGVGGWRLGYEERRRWTNCPCNCLPRFPTYVVMIHQRHGQTDGRTDGRTDDMRSNTALCTKVHRAVKSGAWHRVIVSPLRIKEMQEESHYSHFAKLTSPIRVSAAMLFITC